MIPFFSSRVLSGYAIYRPSFSMPFLAAACVAHYRPRGAALDGWTWVADAPMAAWVGWLAWKWGLTQSFRARLLAMLHLSLTVLAIALAFSARREPRHARGPPGALRPRSPAPARRGLPRGDDARHGLARLARAFGPRAGGRLARPGTGSSRSSRWAPSRAIADFAPLGRHAARGPAGPLGARLDRDRRRLGGALRPRLPRSRGSDGREG